MADNDTYEWVPYHYIPSVPAAAILMVLFALTTLCHTYQFFKKRTWYFIPLIIGGIFEVIGYIGRIASRTNDRSVLGTYIIQSLFILIAPALFAASIYIVLGRIILLVDGERYSVVGRKYLTRLFVAGDVLGFLMQSSGGGLQSGGSLSSLHTGETLIIAGLFAQLAFFSLFVIVAGIFHYRLLNDKPVRRQLSLQFWKRSPVSTARASRDNINITGLPWKRHIYILYTTSILILVRSIFRIIEYIQGNDGYLLSKEVYLYVFDAVLMLAVMVLFNWVHPSQITELYSQRSFGGGDGEMGLDELEATRGRYVGGEGSDVDSQGGRKVSVERKG